MPDKSKLRLEYNTAVSDNYILEIVQIEPNHVQQIKDYIVLLCNPCKDKS